MQSFNCSIEHIEGKSNLVPDCLNCLMTQCEEVATDATLGLWYPFGVNLIIDKLISKNIMLGVMKRSMTMPILVANVVLCSIILV